MTQHKAQSICFAERLQKIPKPMITVRGEKQRSE